MANVEARLPEGLYTKIYHAKAQVTSQGQAQLIRGVPKHRYYDILRYFVLRYVIDTLVPNIDI